MSETKIDETERRYTEKEVCDIYRIDRGTLRRWRNSKLIRWQRLPTGQIRYKQSYLDEFDRRTEKRVRASEAA